MHTAFVITPAIVLACCLAMSASASDDTTLEEVAVSGFEQRVDALFRADSGKPLVRAKKRPPLRKGSGNFTRAYSFSIMRFAGRCFYLNEQLDEANAALAENAKHYLDNPKDIVDRDSFHWHADIVMRLIEMYGSNGTVEPGRMTLETEALCLEPIWTYVQSSAKYNKPNHEESDTWDFMSTENHHAMDFSLHWHFAKLAKDRPEYRDKRFDDGTSLTDHYEAWSDYIVVYCRERAKKGTNIEIMCPGYNSVWLKGFYNFRDFGDPKVRRASEMLMNLYWAYWAQEQLNGVEGGGKTRIRGVNGFSHYLGRGIPALGWCYFGIGEEPRVINGEINALLSDYRPPAVVAEIAHSALESGPFEIRQRAQGLAQTGRSSAIMGQDSLPNRFRTDGGGIVRYSYCDPAFIIGTLMHEARPLDDWAAISSQSRWQGVIFSDSPGARIVPTVRPTGKARDVRNGQWSVQSKGSLITQKLEDNTHGGPMIVWISEEGIGKPIRDGEWVFAETSGAYAAIRVIGSDFVVSDSQVSNPVITGSTRVAPPGKFIHPEDEYAPIILEVMAKTDVEDFEAFKRLVKTRELKTSRSLFSYQTIYDDLLTFDSSYQRAPTVNGKRVDYSPLNVHESPYLNSVYDSGVVAIRKGDQELVLDFTESGIQRE